MSTSSREGTSMRTASPVRGVAWRHVLIVAGAGLFALTIVAPALGGGRDASGLPPAGPSGAEASWTGASPAGMPPAIRGTEGLVPGGPGVWLALGSDNTSPWSEPLRGIPSPPRGLVAVEPDSSRLARDCPASVWQAVTVQAETTPNVKISLTAAAPDGCQGFHATLPLTVTGPAGERIPVSTVVPVTVAVLATPGISVHGEDGQVTVLPIAPTSGPVPTGYTVEVREPHGEWIPRCTAPVATACTLPGAGGTLQRSYRVTARFHEWKRSSAPVVYPALPHDGDENVP
jgi:hypothetical protein